MMDPKPLFPRGYHPAAPWLAPNAKKWAASRTRCQAVFPKYYFIDFGISTWFKEGHQGPRLVIGPHGQDKSVPELSRVIPYDPFKVDIYILGNLFKKELLSVSSHSPVLHLF